MATAYPLARIRQGLDDLPGWLATLDDAQLGEALIETREVIDRGEAVFASSVRRFETSGQYRADGALSVIAWLRCNCKLSGGAAAERVEVARALDQLPKTEEAFARGDVGYQHVAVLARAAEHVGVAAVQKAEASLLQAAETMAPGQFIGVAKNFEHRVDAAAALAEANRAHERRYLHISDPTDGLVRLDGLLDAEGGAILRTALDSRMLPGKDDDRTPGQRRADALVELCSRKTGGSATGAGPRPHLVIRASLDTLLGVTGAPAGEFGSWRISAGGDRPPAGLRCRAHPHHRPGRAGSRNQPCLAEHPAVHPAGGGGAGSDLCGRPLRSPAPVDRLPSPPALDSRRSDEAAEPRPLVPATPSNGPRRGLGPASRGAWPWDLVPPVKVIAARSVSLTG